tara:strand:- start:59 stop:1048 length:990 start_codon:yes stop_codon:yes gene_type:complete
MNEKQLGSLERVDLRNFWADEAKDFTPWLAKESNLGSLSASLEMELELEGIEVPVGPFNADIVAKDTNSNSLVVIENQLEKTNHDHLGKTITYASGLNAQVIIWIAKEFKEEHRKAIDYLNEKASPELRCFAVEIQLLKIGNSFPAPLFKVVASPNEYKGNVEIGSSSLSETKLTYLEFWNFFKDLALQKGTTLSFRKARAQHWFSMAVGRSKFSITLTASIQKKRIGCEVYMRGPNAKKAFRELSRQKDEIENMTGDLDWQELPAGQDCRIIFYRESISISDKTNWADAGEWFKEKAELFREVFGPRIKGLSLSDEMEEDLEFKGAND